jgi:hypothetical protein
MDEIEVQLTHEPQATGWNLLELQGRRASLANIRVAIAMLTS